MISSLHIASTICPSTGSGPCISTSALLPIAPGSDTFWCQPLATEWVLFLSPCSIQQRRHSVCKQDAAQTIETPWDALLAGSHSTRAQAVYRSFRRLYGQSALPQRTVGRRHRSPAQHRTSNHAECRGVANQAAPATQYLFSMGVDPTSCSPQTLFQRSLKVSAGAVALVGGIPL